MINLTSIMDVLRVVTSAAAQVEVHASWVDIAAGAGTLGRTNTPHITTATTTTVVASPAAATQRNVKQIHITNAHATQSCRVVVDHFDGVTVEEIIGFTLLPGENMIHSENGVWTHRDSQGAEYPPAGLGAYNGFSVGFSKNTTAPDAAGYWYCTSKDSGFPGAWVPGTPGVNGRNTDGTLSPDFGCVPIKNPATGANYLTDLQIASTVNHTHLMFDVLWVNSGLVVTTTTAQAITQPTLPPRDINGTTNGEGCSIAMLFTTVSTNAAIISNTTVSYTNSDGVAGRTATLTAIVGSQIPATAVNGTLVWFNLAAGDRGVRSIQSVTLGTTLTTGTISMMVTRDVAMLGTMIVNIASPKVIANPGIRLFNGTTLLHCVQAGAPTATSITAEFSIAEK